MREPIVLALTLAGVVAACTMSYPPCYRGEYRGCTCGTAAGTTSAPATGYQACTVTEDGFEACVCDGTTPGVDGGRDASTSDAADAGEGGEAAAYLAPCSASVACAGADAVCFTFGNKGQLCTKRCAGPDDCPPPSPGCNGMGFCKAP